MMDPWCRWMERRRRRRRRRGKEKKKKKKACAREGRLIGWKGQTGICERVEDCYSTTILDNLYGFEKHLKKTSL